jgi:hypothetical protein
VGIDFQELSTELYKRPKRTIFETLPAGYPEHELNIRPAV